MRLYWNHRRFGASDFFLYPTFSQQNLSVIYLSACERHPLASLNQTHCGRVLTWANHQSHARRGRKLPQLTSSSLNEGRKFWRLGGLMSQWSGVLIMWVCHWRSLMGVRKTATTSGSGVRCFPIKQGWWGAKMAACEEPVSLLIGTEGAGLYNCITADLEVPPPLKLFFCREQLCRESQGDLSLVFFLLCLVILTWRFRKN